MLGPPGASRRVHLHARDRIPWTVSWCGAGCPVLTGRPSGRCCPRPRHPDPVQSRRPHIRPLLRRSSAAGTEYVAAASAVHLRGPTRRHGPPEPGSRLRRPGPCPAGPACRSARIGLGLGPGCRGLGLFFARPRRRAGHATTNRNAITRMTSVEPSLRTPAARAVDTMVVTAGRIRLDCRTRQQYRQGGSRP